MIRGLPGQVERLMEASNHRTEGLMRPQSPCLVHVAIKKWGTRKVKAQGTQVRDRPGQESRFPLSRAEVLLFPSLNF